MSGEDAPEPAVELFAAVARGDLGTVETLLAEQPEVVDAVVAGEEGVDEVPGEGCTPLHLAAQSHQTTIGQRLVEACAEVQLIE